MVRRRLFLILFMTLSVLSGCAPLAGKKLIGQEPPLARMYRLEDGSQVNLSDYKGHYTVVVFWATHCNSSGPIMRRLGPYAASHPNVKIISVSLDKNDDVEAVKNRIRSDGLGSMQQMFSGNEEYDEAYSALKGERLPYVVVLDPAGRVIGVDTDDDIVYTSIDR